MMLYNRLKTLDETTVLCPSEEPSNLQSSIVTAQKQRDTIW